MTRELRTILVSVACLQVACTTDPSEIPPQEVEAQLVERAGSGLAPRPPGGVGARKDDHRMACGDVYVRISRHPAAHLRVLPDTLSAPLVRAVDLRKDTLPGQEACRLHLGQLAADD